MNHNEALISNEVALWVCEDAHSQRGAQVFVVAHRPLGWSGLYFGGVEASVLAGVGEDRGVTSDNIDRFLPHVDAYLVGTGIEQRFGVLDPDEIARLNDRICAAAVTTGS